MTFKPFAAAALLAVNLLTSTAASAGEDRHVRIINETEHTMVRFYASNTSADCGRPPPFRLISGKT